MRSVPPRGSGWGAPAASEIALAKELNYWIQLLHAEPTRYREVVLTSSDRDESEYASNSPPATAWWY